MIGALEDAEDYQGFEAAIIGDYDAQSAVERELVLRFSQSVMAAAPRHDMETDLFEIQANHLSEFSRAF